MEHHEIHTALNGMLAEPRLRNLYLAVRDAFAAKGPSAHGWEHVRRVTVNAVPIGLAEKADMEIVMPAILLHDIGFVTNPDEPKKHPEHGARECYRFLSDWNREQQDHISQAILKHKARYPGYDGIEPDTLEERVVCDADQIDKFGWVGFSQMIKVYAEYGANGVERYQRIAGLADGLEHLSEIHLYTDTGRAMAAKLSEPDHLTLARKLREELSLSEDWSEEF